MMSFHYIDKNKIIKTLKGLGSVYKMLLKTDIFQMTRKRLIGCIGFLQIIGLYERRIRLADTTYIISINVSQMYVFNFCKVGLF